MNPEDSSRDQFLEEPEYHGDANSKEDQALSFRVYGSCLDNSLESLGFSVEYCKKDFPDLGILNTELFYCRLSK